MIDDLSLIEQIKKNNDNNSFNELVNRHTGIYNTIVYKYLHTNNNTDYFDLLENRDYNFYSFISDYNPNKNMKFSSFVGDRTKFLCLSLNFNKSKNNLDQLNEDIIGSDQPDNELLNADTNSVLLKTVNSIKNFRFKEIMKLRFFSSNKVLTWREIAEKIGVSIQCVNKTYNDNIDQFKKTFLKNLNSVKI